MRFITYSIYIVFQFPFILQNLLNAKAKIFETWFVIFHRTTFLFNQISQYVSLSYTGPITTTGSQPDPEDDNQAVEGSQR